MTVIRKVSLFALLLTMLGQGAVVLYIPSFPMLSDALGASHTQIKLSLMLFFLAYGLSQLVYGPVSDRYGRRRSLLVGLAIMLVGCIWAVFSDVLWSFDVARIIQGLGAGATMVLVRAAIRDTMDERQLAKGMSFLSLGFAIGLAAFPIVGGLLSHAIGGSLSYWFGWQLNFYFLGVVVILTMILVWWKFPETFQKNNCSGGFTAYSLTVIKQYIHVALDKNFWIFLLAGVTCYTIIVSYNVMTPFLIQGSLGFSAKDYGFLSIVIGIPFWIGAFLNARYVKRFGSALFIVVGSSVSILAGIGMLTSNWLVGSFNIYTLMVPLAFASFAQAMLWSNIIANALKNFHKFVGVASALFSCLQLALASCVTTGIAFLPDHTPVPLGCILILVGVLVAILTALGYWSSLLKLIQAHDGFQYLKRIKSSGASSLMLFALILTMLGQGAFVLYIPAFPDLSHVLGASDAQIKFTLTVFLISSGLCQIVYGPISDRYGRKKPLLFGMAVMFLGSVWAIFASNLVSFDLARVLQGLGAGSLMVLIRAALRDVMQKRALARGMAYLSIGFATGMGAFPVIGGILTHWINWQANFVFMAIVTLISLGLVLWLFPETVAKVQSRVSILTYSATVIKQYRMVLMDLVFWVFLIAGVVIYSVVVAYNVMTPFLIQKRLGFSAQTYGLMAIVIAVPYWLGAFTNARLVVRVGLKVIMFIGIAVVIISGGCMVLFSLYLSPMNIYVIMIPLVFASYGQALIWTNAMAIALQNFSEFAGVASALFSCLQLALAAGVTIVLALIPDKTEMPLGIVILVIGLAGACLLILGFWRLATQKGAA